VHKVSSKKALEGALDGVRELARKIGSRAEVKTPEFQDVQEPVLADFRKFADAVSEIAAKTPDLQPGEIFRAAVGGMIRQSPDCHTYYFDGRSRIDSRPIDQTGSPNVTPPQGRVLLQPDEAGLQARLLEGGVAWIRWTEFRITGTYDIRAKIKNALDVGLAAGAKAWLFDVRGNVGGNGPDVIAGYFLNGESVMNVDVRTGMAGVQSANKDVRLPDKYQLPIALIQNDAGGSGPEVLAVFMKETKRGTIVGAKSVGCVGSAAPTTLSDGTQIYVAVEEYSGAITGTKYNNQGVAPDVPATDAQAIDAASKLLRDKITKP
jgi:C-terminal processing protease CtpA/Prc